MLVLLVLLLSTPVVRLTPRLSDAAAQGDYLVRKMASFNFGKPRICTRGLWVDHNSVHLPSAEKKHCKVRSIELYGSHGNQGIEKPSNFFLCGFTSRNFVACGRVFGNQGAGLYTPVARCKFLVACGEHSVDVEMNVSVQDELNHALPPEATNLSDNERSNLNIFVSRSNDKSAWQRKAKKWSKHLLHESKRVKIDNSQPITQRLNQYSRPEGSSVHSYLAYNVDILNCRVAPHATHRRCNAVLKMLEGKDENEMMKLFEWMRTNNKLKGNRSAYNLVLRVLGQREEWDKAEAMLEEMCTDSGCVLTCQVFNSLIYACYKKGLVTWGTKWFRMMLDKNVQPNQATVGMIMILYKNSNNLADAEFAFCQMRHFRLCCCVAYSAMMTIYTRLGLYEKSEEVIAFMKDDGVLPNIENWLVRLNTYCQQGKLQEAESAMRDMREAGISPNIVAYNTLITGYGKMADIEGAQCIFQSLRSINLVPDETTYRSMVEGCGRAGKYRETLWYYNELKQLGFHPNASNFYTIINLQAKHKDDEGVIQTLEDMKKVGCQYSSIVSSLLQAYKRVERLDNVPSILKASFYDQLLLDQTSCSILVLAYIENDMVDDALQVLQEKGWNDHVYEDNLYHLLICSCKESGSYKSAVKIFMQMPTSNERQNLHIMCSMINIYSAMGNFRNAEDLFFKLKSSNCELDMVAYSVILRMYIKEKSFADASTLIDMMERQKDILPDAYLFRDILRIYKELDMPEKLADVYYRILKNGIVWDEAMYNCVINCCGHALPIDELSRLFEEMIRCGFPPNTVTFNVVIHIYCKAGFFKKAWKALRMAQKLGVADAISFNTIIAAYGKNKDFKKMKYAARQMQYAGFEISLEAYNSMLDAYGKEDRVEEFKDILRKMKAGYCVSDHYTYNIMINIYGKKGWIEEVANVLSELKERGLEPDLWSYNTLIKAYGVAGMIEEAVRLVKEMRDKGVEPDQITYANLVAALQMNDNFLEAVKWSLWMKQLGLSSLKR